MGQPHADDDPTWLRARALALRLLSLRLRSSPANVLHRFAGPGTWVGATPQACLDELSRVPADVEAAAVDLDSAARLLDRRADEAEWRRWLDSTGSGS